MVGRCSVGAKGVDAQAVSRRCGLGHGERGLMLADSRILGRSKIRDRPNAGAGEVAGMASLIGGALRAECRRPGACAGGPHPVGAYLPLESSPRGREGVCGDVFVEMNGLSMLTEVVESREAAQAVTLEGTFSRVLSVQKLATARTKGW